MENFIVSARKYRPTTFDSVVGQNSITSTLKNAIKSSHLAQAFLFCGPRGVGKTTCARILAKTINCFNVSENIEACNECESCKAFDEGHSLNIHELDGASNNSVDDIRNLIEQVRFAPQLGTHKVYIIDEVHMLSQAAFNAFLKTLEEPPKHAIFILATTEKHKIIPTILSRCQIFDFNRIQIDDIAKHLAKIGTNEKIEAEEDGLHIIAQKADGALRDALSMFDQIVSFSGGTITYKDVIENLNILDYDYYFRVTDAVISQNVSDCLLTYNEILNHGFDGHNFINGLAEHFRNLLVCLDEKTVSLLEVGINIKEKYVAQAKSTNVSDLIKALSVTNTADTKYKSSKNQRLLVEVMLMQLCALSNELSEKKNSIIDLPFNKANGIDTKPKPAAPAKKSEPKPIITETEVAIEQVAATMVKETITAINKPTEAVPISTSVNISFSENISISSTAVSEKKLEEETLDDLSNKPTENYSTEDFLVKWAEFKSILESKNKTNLASIFEETPSIKDDTILVSIENKALEDEFNAQKADFLEFVRTELSNFNIQVKTEINKDLKAKKAYTPQEKFAKMNEKNPQLMELVKKLDMDVGYA
jgi:DNA polymerase-3 subunit gamma/tau